MSNNESVAAETGPIKAHTEHQEFLGYDDPHKAALEDNPEKAEKLTWAVGLSALFLGTSFTGPIIFGTAHEWSS